MTDGTSVSFDDLKRTNRRGYGESGPIRKPHFQILRPLNEVNLNTESKIIVSNLGYKVTEADLYELFGEMIGPVREIALDYDKLGHFKGSAVIVFARRGDAVRAVERFRGVTLDGQELKIEVIVMPRKTPICQRMGSIDPNFRRGVGFRGGLRNGRLSGRKGYGLGGRSQGPTPTKEQLDTELDEYMQIED
ncbi:7399_t:CDS:2 [Ambispora gerdemannii]|uniref:7399_t:CDS:1 n=1 Tax=Ambispora gerdemannii TaxID=144530 RepID=A0A9N8YJ16_9GLOM|nr:7399_t:CDS:2 [Ambispora gerdemannii]